MPRKKTTNEMSMVDGMEEKKRDTKNHALIKKVKQ